MANYVGYKSKLTGEVFAWNPPEMSSPELDGMGNPPGDPEYGKRFPGQGKLEMEQVIVTVKSNKLVEVGDIA